MPYYAVTASHNLCLRLQSHSFLSLPFPWHEQDACPVLTPLLALTIASFSSCCRVWLDYCFPHFHVTDTDTFRWTEAHLPSTWATSKSHFSETLCITLHDFLVEWERDLGLADNIYLYICLYFFWTLSYQLLQTPTAFSSAGIVLACDSRCHFQWENCMAEGQIQLIVHVVSCRLC